MRKERSLQSRLSLRLAILMFTAMLVLALILLYSFRSLGLKTSQDKAQLATEIVRNALVAAMEQGEMEERDDFLSLLLDVGQLKEVHVVRGPAVADDLGEPNPKFAARDDVERAVLATGKEQTLLTETMDQVLYRIVVPVKAIQSDVVDCTTCHEVPVGTVLGAVGLSMPTM